MIDNSKIISILDKQWKKLTKEEPNKYYALFFVRELEDNNISTVAFKFPTYEDLCCSDPYLEEQKIIDSNIIHILDMRTFYKNTYVPYSALYIFNPIYSQLDPREATKEQVADLFTKFYSYEKYKDIDVYSTLTKTERAAAHEIYYEIGIEGDISISKLIQVSGISRPVFNNLLNIFANTNSAEVIARGVKGTHIKFTNPLLIKRLTQN